MGILENPKKYYALAAQMRAMADAEADPSHADRLRRVAIAYEKRAWAMEDKLKSEPPDVALLAVEEQLVRQGLAADTASRKLPHSLAR